MSNVAEFDKFPDRTTRRRRRPGVAQLGAELGGAALRGHGNAPWMGGPATLAKGGVRTWAARSRARTRWRTRAAARRAA